MPRAVEDDHDQILDVTAERPCDGPQVVLDGRVQIHGMFGRGADHELLHVEIGRVQQPALLRRREHGDRVRGAHGAEVRPLERIDGDVYCWIAAVAVLGMVSKAHLLADVQHRRLVALSLADDDGAVDRHAVHLAAHGFHRNLIGFVAVSLPHGVSAGNGSLLHHAQEIE